MELCPKIKQRERKTKFKSENDKMITILND